MRKLIIPAVLFAALTFTTAVEAGPIRGVLSKIRGKPRAAAAKAMKVAKSPVKAVRQGGTGGCANGQCAK